MKCKIMDVDNPNSNNRIYTKDVMEIAIKKYKEEMVDKTRAIVFNRSSGNRENDLQDAYGLVQDIFIEDGSVYIEMKPLTLSNSEYFTEQINSGILHPVTSGVGKIKEQDGNTYIYDYELTSIFLDKEPSYILK